jgi:hypothetical protein
MQDTTAINKPNRIKVTSRIFFMDGFLFSSKLKMIGGMKI